MRRIQILGLLFVAILLALPLIGVEIGYGKQIEFVSYRFEEEYWKFLGGLGSVAFGFYLVNILWSEKEVGELTNQTKRLLLNHLLRINKTCLSIDELIKKQFPEENYDESQKRDLEVLKLKNNIQIAGMALEKITIDLRSLKDDSVKKVYLELIWGDLLPNIDRLSPISNFRDDYDEFINTINRISIFSIAGINELNSCKRRGVYDNERTT